MAAGSRGITKVGASVGHGRVAWVDHARGIGIILVVLGHTLRGLVASLIIEPSAVSDGVDAFIYAFHMPLFFLLAGLFSPHSIDRRTADFLGEKLRTIAYPYVLWSLLQTCTQIVLARFVNQSASPQDLLRIPYEPMMQFWFLYALFLIFILMHLMRRLRLSWVQITVTSTLLYVAIPLIGCSWWIANAALLNFPYVALGALGYTTLSRRLPELSAAQSIAGAALGFGAVSAGIYYGADRGLWLTPVFALAGTAASLCLANALSKRGGLPLLAMAGEMSLAIYVAHTLFSAGTRIILSHLLHVQSAPVHLFAGVLTGLAGPMLMVRAFERLNFRYAWAWPKKNTIQVASA
jgi:fucose 4-O-acetylase-like acetyltransferase